MSTEVYYWPDDDWCYGDELHQMAHKSDDYSMIEIAGESWEEIDMIVRAKNGGAP